MLGITDIGAFTLGAIAIVLLPGPNSIYVLSTAAQRGVKVGYQAALGVFAGDGILMFLTAAGVASLLRAFPVAFTAVKWAGAVYLGYVGLRMIISTLRARSAPSQPVVESDALRPTRKAFVISLANPKAILFFVSFFVQFVDPAYGHPALSFLVLAAIMQVVSAAYLSALIFGGSYLAEAFRRRQLLAKIGSTAVGAIFVGFGIKLATATI